MEFGNAGASDWLIGVRMGSEDVVVINNHEAAVQVGHLFFIGRRIT